MKLRLLQNFKLKTLASLAVGMSLAGCAIASQRPEVTETGATEPSASGQNLPEVVATTSVICDLTQQLADETINLNCLVAPGEDPHLYQPLPDDRKAIDRANLILYGGYDFEPSLIRLIKATNNQSPKIAVHEVAVPNPIIGKPHDHGHHDEHDEHEHDEHEHDDHEHDEHDDHEHDDHEHDDHSAGETAPDPHVWHNAENGIRMVEVISDALKNLSPSHTSLYESNAQQINTELTQLHSWIGDRVATIPPAQRQLVTTHDALGYYVQAYGLKFEGALSGFSTEEAATASRIGELVQEIKSAEVPTIFAESSINPRLIEQVAKEANVKVYQKKLYADGLGEAGTQAETYQKMLKHNTESIVQGLGGQD
jgi:manganese/iron transport system substrate-binding protein